MSNAPSDVLDGVDLQRRQALDQANAIRRVRSAVKFDLTAGRVDLADLLVDPPEDLATMPLRDLMMAVPSYGQSRTQKTLARLAIPLQAKVGSLTFHQRARLVDSLDNK